MLSVQDFIVFDKNSKHVIQITVWFL